MSSTNTLDFEMVIIVVVFSDVCLKALMTCNASQRPFMQSIQFLSPRQSFKIYTVCHAAMRDTQMMVGRQSSVWLLSAQMRQQMKCLHIVCCVCSNIWSHK